MHKHRYIKGVCSCGRSRPEPKPRGHHYRAPNPRKQAIRIMPDGREIINTSTPAGRLEYRGRVLAMWHRQGELCCICNKDLRQSDATFEHTDGRGMGGGRRDDRCWKDGKPINGAAHYWCNVNKGSRRLEATQ